MKRSKCCAGLVLMQLAIPKLRTISALKVFNQQFRKAGYNIQTWKKRQALPHSETAILDLDNGLGWSLVGALLRPRGIQVANSLSSYCILALLRVYSDDPFRMTCQGLLQRKD